MNRSTQDSTRPSEDSPIAQHDAWCRSHYGTGDLTWMWKNETISNLPSQQPQGSWPSSTTAPDSSINASTAMHQAYQSGPNSCHKDPADDLKDLPKVGQHLPESDCDIETFAEWLCVNRRNYFKDFEVTSANEKKRQLKTQAGRRLFPTRALGAYPTGIWRDSWRRICWECWYQSGHAYRKTHHGCRKH